MPRIARHPRNPSVNRRSGLLGPKRRPLAPRQFTGMESLEDRRVLDANLLDSVDGSIGTAGATNDVLMNVSFMDAGPSARATLLIRSISLNGLDTAAPDVSGNGNASVTMLSAMHDSHGSSDGMSVVHVGPGDFTLTIGSENVAAGPFRIEVALLGDIDAADSMVSDFEAMRASAALVQELGTGNFITKTFYAQHGIDMSVSQFDPGMDINGDGTIDGDEFHMIDMNANMGRVMVRLQADAEAPVISNVRLVNDTGTSSTDRITTDPSVRGNISDESTISSILASLNGSPDVEILPLLGDVNATGTFTLSRSTLETVFGGPLPAGLLTLELVASDDVDNATDPPVQFQFTFIPSNLPPVIAGGDIPDRATQEDAPFNFNAGSFFSDPNPGDVLRFTGSNGTAFGNWLTINPTTGVLTGTPDNDDVGPHTINVTAIDSQGSSTTASFILTVQNVNDAPVISPVIPNQQATEDQLFSLDLDNFIRDVDVGDTLTISVDQADGVDGSGNPINLRELPDWLTFNATTRVLSGTPSADDIGSFGVFVIAVDQAGADASQFFTIQVVDAPEPPMLVTPIPDQEIDQDEFFSIDLSAFFNDPDPGDALTFAVSPRPSWLNLNAATGVLSGTPDNDDIAGMDLVLNLTVTATDTFDLSVSDTFVLSINNLNDAPQITPDQEFVVSPSATNGTLVGMLDFSDPDAQDTLTLEVIGGTGANAFAVDQDGDITVSNASLLQDNTDLTLQVRVTDSGNLSDTETVTVLVRSNRPPTANTDVGFTVEDIEILEIDAADLLSNDTDPDGDTLSVVQVFNSSLGATVELFRDQITYDPASSLTLVSLGPGEQRVDTFEYEISDGRGGTDRGTVSVTVIGVDVVEFFVEFFVGTNEVTQVNIGDTFDLVVSVQDRRPNPRGVFSAFTDVQFPPALLTAVGPIIHADTYDAGTSGTFDNATGLLDEVGGVDGLNDLGGGVLELFRITMVADAPGIATFTTSPATNGPSDTTVFGISIEIVPEQIIYGSASLTIGGALIPPASLSAGGGSVPLTNPSNPLDVNGDNSVTPLDALLVINRLDSNGGSSNGFMDVNADGGVTPMDALLVINHLDSVQAAPKSGSASGSPDLDDDEYTSHIDEIFAQLNA
jgi:hypothetical protein